MKPTRKQLEFLVDVLKSIGVPGFIGGIADAFVVGTRLGLDVVCVCVAAVVLAIAYRLTRKLDGGIL